MNSDSRHVIMRQVVELVLPKGQSPQPVQDKAVAIFRSELLHHIARVLDACVPAHLQVRIDCLDIDLGNLSITHWESEFVKRFEAAFAKAVQDAVEQQLQKEAAEEWRETARIQNKSAASGASPIPPAQPSTWEALETFLTLGILPWWVKERGKEAIQLLVKELLAYPPLALPKYLAQVVEHPEALSRLLFALQDTQLLALLNVTPSHEGWTPSRIQGLSTLLQQADTQISRHQARALIWENLFAAAETLPPTPSALLQSTLQVWAESTDQTPIYLWQNISAHKRTHTHEQQAWLKATLETLPTQATSSSNHKAKATRLERALADLRQWLAKAQQGDVETTTLSALLKALAARIEDKEFKKEILQLAQQSSSLPRERKPSPAQLPSYEGIQSLAEALRAEAQQCPAPALLEAHTLLLELGQQHKSQTQSASIALSLRHLSEEFLRYLHGATSNALPVWLPLLAQKLQASIPFFTPPPHSNHTQRARLLLAEHLAALLTTWDNSTNKAARSQYTTLSQQIQRLSINNLATATEWKSLQTLLSRIRPKEDFLNHRTELLQKLEAVQAAETTENPIDHTALDTSLKAVANFEEINAATTKPTQQRAQWMAIAALLHQTASQALGQETRQPAPQTDKTWTPWLQQQTTELRQVLDLHFAQQFSPQLKTLQRSLKELQNSAQTPQALEAFSLALSKLLHQVQLELRANKEAFTFPIIAALAESPTSSSSASIKEKSNSLTKQEGLDLTEDKAYLPPTESDFSNPTPPVSQPSSNQAPQSPSPQENKPQQVLQKVLGLVAEMVLDLITATESLLKKLSSAAERPAQTQSLNELGRQWETILQVVEPIQDQELFSSESAHPEYSPSQSEDLAAICFEIALQWVDLLDAEAIEKLSPEDLINKAESLEETGIGENKLAQTLKMDAKQEEGKTGIERFEHLKFKEEPEAPLSKPTSFDPEEAELEVESVEISFENPVFGSNLFSPTEVEKEGSVEIIFEKPSQNFEASFSEEPQEPETASGELFFENPSLQPLEAKALQEDEIATEPKSPETLLTAKAPQSPTTFLPSHQQRITSKRNTQTRQFLSALQQLKRQLSTPTLNPTLQTPQALPSSETINPIPAVDPESKEFVKLIASEEALNTSSAQPAQLDSNPEPLTSPLLQTFLHTLSGTTEVAPLDPTSLPSHLSEEDKAAAARTLDINAPTDASPTPPTQHLPLLPFLRNWQQHSQDRPLPSPISTRLHKAITLISEFLSTHSTSSAPSAEEKTPPSLQVHQPEEPPIQHPENQHIPTFQDQLSTFLQPQIILSSSTPPQSLKAPQIHQPRPSSSIQYQLWDETIQVLHTLLRHPSLRHSLNTDLAPHLKDPEATKALPTGALPQLEQIATRLKTLLREPLPARIHQSLRNLQQTIAGTSSTVMDLRAVKRILQQANQVLAQTQKGKPQTRKQPEKDEAIYIDNAGLILLWPFLPRFFQNLGLLEGREFTSPEAHARAVLMLQHLVDAEPETSEHLLPLCKLLCAYPSDRSINTNLEPTEEEREACEQLLGVVPHHHPAMKNMSAEGFRKAWLQREGVLRSRDDHYLLHVEKQAYDILLEQMPWSIRIIKLPWMQAAIMVEW